MASRLPQRRRVWVTPSASEFYGDEGEVIEVANLSASEHEVVHF